MDPKHSIIKGMHYCYVGFAHISTLKVNAPFSKIMFN